MRTKSIDRLQPHHLMGLIRKKPFMNSRPYPRDFLLLLLPLLKPRSDEQGELDLLHFASGLTETVQKFKDVSKGVRDRRRDLLRCKDKTGRKLSFAEGPNVVALEEAARLWDEGNRTFLSKVNWVVLRAPYAQPLPISEVAPWTAQARRTAVAILSAMRGKIATILPLLYQQFPDEAEELRWIENRALLFVKALWGLHEALDRFVPRSYLQQKYVKEALENIFGNQNIALQALWRVFQGSPREARTTIWQAFDPSEGSTFDPRQYWWYWQQDDRNFRELKPDLSLIEGAMKNLYSFEQSFIATAALWRLLSNVPMRYAYSPYLLQTGKGLIIDRPLICQVDFSPWVDPQTWPFADAR